MLGYFIVGKLIDNMWKTHIYHEKLIEGMEKRDIHQELISSENGGKRYSLSELNCWYGQEMLREFKLLF